jgi:S1-C subfamily serine protease
MAGAYCPSRSFKRLLWFVSVAAGTLLTGPLGAHDFATSVVKIHAVDAKGSESFGSGVVIATDLLATACHVTREAKTIEIAHGTKRWFGRVESGSPTHDLCLISVPQLDLPALAIRASKSLQIGERVVAVGFPNGGDLAVRDGVVEGLYPYDGGQVIRASATFDAGASGGGLFDEEGALVGLLAFKARSGARLHFALPADWALPGTMVSSLLGPVEASTQRRAFWEVPRASQPSFLGHAMLEAASQR